MIYKCITELIGGTPLVELVNIERKYSLKARLLAKIESANPAGSAKDRVALSIIDDAEKSGRLMSGGTVIEATSGNTGIGICAICAARGYKAVIVMPETMSEERKKLVRAYGATLVLTDGALGMSGAVKKAGEILDSTENAIIASQFDNPANPRAHYETTGPEIYSDTGGNIDIFVAGIGTGGTISGVGKYLKEQNVSIKIVGVEPETSPLISRGYSGKHDLQGIGANFVPANYDASVVDDIMTVSDSDAYTLGRELAGCEGILSGITSGAAVFAAIKLARMSENEGKTIVALLPDTGERYLSTKMFE
ncbi:MAG: cysteine synthase A [Clostridiales bacterium]|nr:cysteine synthase A [Clostridiales bacterium]